MLNKNKIRLARHLTAQTTPYPYIKTWIKRGFFIFLATAAVGIYFAARPSASIEAKPEKQVLGEVAAPAEMMIYQIGQGDTLFNVSQKYEISWQTLAEINNLSEPYILKVGQKLKIPSL